MLFRRLPARFTLTTLALSCWALTAQAAEHPLTKIHYDAQRNVNVLDLVMSIDWDFDAPPAGRDKAFLEEIIKQSSKSLYTMTEGRQMLGTVYVYKNSQFMDNTDIQYLIRDGRANAHVSGLTHCKGCRNQMFAGTNETAIDHGKTLAHEYGHYVLGLFDEYREQGGTSVDPGSPQDGDTPKNTVMQDQIRFAHLSTAEDYTDPTTRKTAHYRMYQQSAWETLTSAPTNSPANYPNRISFEAFRHMPVPTSSAALTQPTSGWENDLKVVYMGSSDAPTTANSGFAAANASGPINLIVIDTTTSKAQLDAQIHAAQQVVSKAGDNSRVAVITYPFANQLTVATTRLSSASERHAIKTQLGKITQDSSVSDTVAGDRLFDYGEAALPHLFPKGPVSMTGGGYYYRLYPTGNALGVAKGKLYFYDGRTVAELGPVETWLPKAKRDLSAALDRSLELMKTVVRDGDTPNVLLFTTANQTVNKATVQAFRDAKVAIHPVALLDSFGGLFASPNRFSSTADRLSLFDVANQTVGEFREASKPGDLLRAAADVIHNAEGDEVQLVNDDAGHTLAAGQSQSLSSIISSADVDDSVHFQASWSQEDDGKLSFSLIAPNGQQIRPDQLPVGVSYVQPEGEDFVEFVVDRRFTARAGQWKSQVTASKALVEPVFLTSTVKSKLTAILDLFGGTAEDSRPLTAVVELSGPLSVKGAKVVGTVQAADTGKVVKANVEYRDDGVAPDLRAGDGHYTASLADLPIGEYAVSAKVSNDGKAVFTTASQTRKGTNAPEQVIAPFERSVHQWVNKQK